MLDDSRAGDVTCGGCAEAACRQDDRLGLSGGMQIPNPTSAGSQSTRRQRCVWPSAQESRWRGAAHSLGGRSNTAAAFASAAAAALARALAGAGQGRSPSTDRSAKASDCAMTGIVAASSTETAPPFAIARSAAAARDAQGINTSAQRSHAPRRRERPKLSAACFRASTPAATLVDNAVVEAAPPAWRHRWRAVASWSSTAVMTTATAMAPHFLNSFASEPSVATAAATPRSCACPDKRAVARRAAPVWPAAGAAAPERSRLDKAPAAAALALSRCPVLDDRPPAPRRPAAARPPPPALRPPPRELVRGPIAVPVATRPATSSASSATLRFVTRGVAGAATAAACSR